MMSATVTFWVWITRASTVCRCRRCPRASPKVIRVLAIRVNFKKEVPDDPQTTGYGTFDMRTKAEFKAQEGHLIDPAPHNQSYFLKHMEALADYYRVVSNGRLAVPLMFIRAIPTRHISLIVQCQLRIAASRDSVWANSYLTPCTRLTVIRRSRCIDEVTARTSMMPT